MRSYRCARCWISFDARRKARDHEQLETCEVRPPPESDCFMDHELEAEMEKPCGRMLEEDKWWMLFRLLIPGMQDRDDQSLKAEYYPCTLLFSHIITMRLLTNRVQTTSPSTRLVPS